MWRVNNPDDMRFYLAKLIVIQWKGWAYIFGIIEFKFTSSQLIFHRIPNKFLRDPLINTLLENFHKPISNLFQNQYVFIGSGILFYWFDYYFDTGL